MGDTAAAPGSGPDMDARVIRRYLAARAFGSWMPYQAGGISAVLLSLRLIMSVLESARARVPLKQAIRETDLQLLHLTPRALLVSAVRGAGFAPRIAE